MAENWSRRALLASLGAFTLSGCIASNQDEGTESTPASPGDESPTSPGDESPSEPQDEPTAPEQIIADWPMPAYDAGRSNYSPAAGGLTEPLAELWSATMDASLSAPVLADEMLFVGGDDGSVRAIDSKTGGERWRQSVGAPVDTPWVIDNRVVVPTAEGIVALGTGDGTEAWRANTPSRASVLVASHGVYWLTPDPIVGSLELEDGTERWRTEFRDPWNPHLFAGDGSVFVSTGTNGRIPWTFDSETGDVVGDEPESGHDFPAERFSLDGAVYAVDPFFGSVSGDGWSQGVDAVGEYALSGGGNRVYYIANDGEEPGLYALSRTDGTVEWTRDAVTEVVGRPVVAGESVLVRSDDMLYCFDSTDGTERWSRSSDGLGKRFIVADDLVYTTQDATLRGFRPP